MDELKRNMDWQETDNAVLILENKVNPSRVQHTSLDTLTLPEKEQFSFWRESTTNIGILERPDTYLAPFEAKSENFYTASLIYSRHSITGHSSINRTNRHVDNIEIDALAIQLRLGGLEIDNCLNSGRHFQPGDIRILDLAQPFYSENRGYDNIALLVSKKDIRNRLPDLERLHGKTLSESPMTEFLRSHFKAGMKAVPNLTYVEAEQMADLSMETLCAALLTNATPNAIESDHLNKPVMRAVQHFIKQHLRDTGLSPTQIAQEVGVSRATLFRLCKPYGTPMELVRTQRLKTARDIMQTQKARTVEEAAYMVGYENRSSFSRAFQKEFGMSARDFLQSNSNP